MREESGKILGRYWSGCFSNNNRNSKEDGRGNFTNEKNVYRSRWECSGCFSEKVRLSMISSWGQAVTDTVYVMNGGRNNLLGRPEVRKFNLVRTVRLVKEEVQSKHPKQFRELGELPDVFRINLKDGPFRCV